MKWKKLNKNRKTITILVCIIFIIELLVLVYLAYNYYESAANFLYGSNPDSNGKLLTTILTTLGGYGALYGLYLNSKKVNELVRQNDISTQNSNDKRFGEAIGYLNNDNEGIAIGGVYALYQLAKEDKRYAPIITNIFYNYVNDNTNKQEKKSYQTILSLLFSKDNPFVFDGRPEYSNIIFKNIKMYCEIDNVRFNNCTLDNANIKGFGKIYLCECTIKNSIFIDFNNIGTLNGKFSSWVIISRNESYINITADELYNTHMIINDIKFLRLYSESFNDVNVHSNYIYELKISKLAPKDSLSKLLIRYVSKVENKQIDDEYALSNNMIKFIKCDAILSDSFYKQLAGFQD